MAGPISEADDLNIGTVENSSRPEIEPETEAVEAIGDSDEVCGLERKECDHMMEHLKNNPGLVVKSLGPEGRILLHEAMMADETKKPKLTASKCTVKGLSEGAADSAWYLALERQDCKALMALLEENPCLMAQTGPKGWTVLHAAAHRGCVQLLDQVWFLFDNDLQQFMDERSGIKVAWDHLRRAKCGTFEAEVHHMAWFTCNREVMFERRWLRDGLGGFLGTEQSSRDASQDLTHKLVGIMQRKRSEKAFEFLKEKYQEEPDYNFVLDRKELQFHYACGQMQLPDSIRAFDYLRTIIAGCKSLGSSEHDAQVVSLLTYLFQLHNAQGQTPLHVALASGSIYWILRMLPGGDAYEGCLNAKDVRGWTVLHCAAATRNHAALDALLKDKRVDPDIRTLAIDGVKILEAGMTALHLAILHKDARSVELLLQCPRTDVNAVLYRCMLCGYERMCEEEAGGNKSRRSYWSPLHLAAFMGQTVVVRALFRSKRCHFYNDGKLQNNSIVRVNSAREPTLSPLFLASASGNPDTLQLFLDNKKTYNPLVKTEEGATTLHYATNAKLPTTKPEFEIDKVGCLLFFTDCRGLDLDTRIYKEELEDLKLTPTSYLGRQACITILLQAGVDIWEKDKQDRFAGPGPQAPEEALLWWHEKMAREILEAKMSLNNAANAISIVAALVATASYVGPLQPPLGYGGDSVEGGVQDTHLSVRVFMLSNNLSFYLAVASILFAVVPSLPMPQEGMYAEWQRTRRTVGVAIFFLLMSVLGVLISFGAASNSVVSKDYSWKHDGLSFYPALVGGFICIVAISLFFLRLLRLVFNRNAKIKFLYQTFVKF